MTQWFCYNVLQEFVEFYFPTDKVLIFFENININQNNNILRSLQEVIGQIITVLNYNADAHICMY